MLTLILKTACASIHGKKFTFMIQAESEVVALATYGGRIKIKTGDEYILTRYVIE